MISDIEDKYSMQWAQDGAKPPLGGAWVLTQKITGMSRAKDESQEQRADGSGQEGWGQGPTLTFSS